MRALRFDRFGLDALTVTDVPDPTRRPDEIIVEVHASSINPSDVKNVQGRMRQTTLPRTPGRDYAGIVIDGPRDLLGREVWGTGGELGFTSDGGHAQKLRLPARAARMKPSALSIQEAACVGVNYVTAYVGLVNRAKLIHDETVLVTGASGGVGSSVIKIALAKEARIIAVNRHALAPNEARAQSIHLSLGSEHDDIVARVKEFTNGHGVNVAFDCVGGSLFETCLKCLGIGGRQVNITSVGERRVSFDLLDFYHQQATLLGVDSLALDSVTSGEVLQALRPMFEEKRLTAPRIDRTVALEEAPHAYKDVDSGKANGKIVITMR